MRATDDAAAAPRGWRRHALPALLLVLLAFLLRAPSWRLPVIDADESMFILLGQEVLAGRWPFVTMMDNKPIGLWLFFAAALAVAPDPVLGARWLGAASIAATALVLYAATHDQAGRRGPAFAAGFLAIAFTTGLEGMASHTEILLAPWLAGGFLLAARGLGGPAAGIGALPRLAAMGLLAGIAVSIKQVAVLPMAAFFAVLVGGWLLRREIGLKRAVALGAVFGTVAAAPLALAGLLFLLAGHWQPFWFGHVGFMGAYAAFGPPLFEALRRSVLAMVEIWPVLFLGAVALPVLWMWSDAPRRRVLVLLGAWYGASALAVIAPRQFFDHYFLLLVPPAAMLTAWLLWSLAERFVLPGARRGALAATSAFLAAMILFQILPGPLVANLRGTNPIRLLSADIRAEPAATRSVFVASSSVIIYALAGVRPPTRYPYAAHIIGTQTFMSATDADDELRRILQAAPTFLVVEEDTWQESRPAANAMLRAALDERYELARRYGGWRQDILLYRLR